MGTSMPGMASCSTRITGSLKLWITSFEVTWMMAGRFTSAIAGLRIAAGPEAIENVQKVRTPEYEQYEHQPVGPYDEVVDFVSMRRIVRRHVAGQELPQRAPPSIR